MYGRLVNNGPLCLVLVPRVERFYGGRDGAGNEKTNTLFKKIKRTINSPGRTTIVSPSFSNTFSVSSTLPRNSSSSSFVTNSSGASSAVVVSAQSETMAAASPDQFSPGAARHSQIGGGGKTCRSIRSDETKENTKKKTKSRRKFQIPVERHLSDPTRRRRDNVFIDYNDVFFRRAFTKRNSSHRSRYTFVKKKKKKTANLFFFFPPRRDTTGQKLFARTDNNFTLVKRIETKNVSFFFLLLFNFVVGGK